MRQLLPFVSGGERYALSLTDIQEIVEDLTIYPFPGAPQVVAGAIAFHGRIVPVVDLSRLLGSDAGHLGARLIVLTDAWGPVALAVEQVLSIVKLENICEQAVDETVAATYVKKFVHTESLVLALLDLDLLAVQLEQLCVAGGD